MSWRAIAQLEAEAFASSMGQAYNVCHVAHTRRGLIYRVLEKEQKYHAIKTIVHALYAQGWAV